MAEEHWCTRQGGQEPPPHQPLPPTGLVQALFETLSFRQIGVVHEGYAVPSDGMRMFGVLDLTTGFEGSHFALGVRNSHDRTFRLSSSCGVRFVCENLALPDDFTPATMRQQYTPV